MKWLDIIDIHVFLVGSQLTFLILPFFDMAHLLLNNDFLSYTARNFSIEWFPSYMLLIKVWSKISFLRMKLKQSNDNTSFLDSVGYARPSGRFFFIVFRTALPSSSSQRISAKLPLAVCCVWTLFKPSKYTNQCHETT